MPKKNRINIGNIQKRLRDQVYTELKKEEKAKNSQGDNRWEFSEDDEKHKATKLMYSEEIMMRIKKYPDWIIITLNNMAYFIF